MLNVDRLSSPISFAANCFFLFFGAVLLWSKVILFTSMSQRKEKILHIQLEIDSGHIGSRSEHSVTEIWDSVGLSSANYQLRDPTASNDTENCWMNWISKKKFGGCMQSMGLIALLSLKSRSTCTWVWATANKIVTSRGTVHKWGWVLSRQLNCLVIHKDVLTTVIPFGLTKVPWLFNHLKTPSCYY